MDSGGFKPGRLAIIFICALTLLAAILIEKNQDRILKRLKAGRDADPAPAPQEQKSAPPAPQAQKSAAARSKWQLPWESSALDDIRLVYEKAEANDDTAWKLYQLET